jgi:hypothetical protein
MHTLVALTLIAGLGYAECTGGLFAIPQALAESIGVEDEELLMSIAPTECKSVQIHAAEDFHRAYRHGCDDSSSCLQQVQRNAVGIVANIEGREMFQKIITTTYFLVSSYVVDDVLPSLPLARAGPSVHALNLAHTIVKRE